MFSCCMLILYRHISIQHNQKEEICKFRLISLIVDDVRTANKEIYDHSWPNGAENCHHRRTIKWSDSLRNLFTRKLLKLIEKARHNIHFSDKARSAKWVLYGYRPLFYGGCTQAEEFANNLSAQLASPVEAHWGSAAALVSPTWEQQQHLVEPQHLVVPHAVRQCVRERERERGGKDKERRLSYQQLLWEAALQGKW